MGDKRNLVNLLFRFSNEKRALKMDEFWRDKIKHRLLILKQRLKSGCVLDVTEIKILKFLVEKAFEVVALDIPIIPIAQIEFRFEQILKQELSDLQKDEDGDTKEEIEEARQFLKTIPKFELEK